MARKLPGKGAKLGANYEETADRREFTNLHRGHPQREQEALFVHLATGSIRRAPHVLGLDGVLHAYMQPYQRADVDGGRNKSSRRMR